jgi:hypothetical protein
MQVRPWHAFILVGVLILVGRDFRIAGGEDFVAFAFGTLFLGSLVAGIIWFFTRKQERKK